VIAEDRSEDDDDSDGTSSYAEEKDSSGSCASESAGYEDMASSLPNGELRGSIASSHNKPEPQIDIEECDEDSKLGQ